MKNVIKLITPVALMFLFAISSNAQTASNKVTEGKQCDPKACAQKVCDVKNCDPKLCTAQMPQCNKGAKTAMGETSTAEENTITRVAAASAERTATETTKTPSCTSGKSNKCCAKKTTL